MPSTGSIEVLQLGARDQVPPWVIRAVPGAWTSLKLRSGSPILLSLPYSLIGPEAALSPSRSAGIGEKGSEIMIGENHIESFPSA